MTFLVFLIGLTCLVIGAELLVKGASRFGLAVGISPLVIGLTIVAFGTSSPEMAVSVKAALFNHPDIVLGTCIGSTIFNILFILGISAIITPLVVSQQLIWYEVPIMIAVHLLLYLFCLGGVISRFESFILFGAILAYTYYAIRKGMQDSKSIKDEYENAFKEKVPGLSVFNICKLTGLILAGLALCVFGASLVLDSAVIMARALGVSELVIAMTIIGAGTSLPEVATSVTAAIRGQKDIAIGNVVGSNIFNILAIIGAAGMISPNGIAVSPAVLSFDLPVAIAACVACLPVFFTGHTISRWEGFLFLAYYVAYTSYLILDAKGHEALPLFNALMGWFVIPLTLLSLGIVVYRSWVARKT